MSGVPRGESTSTRIAEEYFTARRDLPRSPDLLIVTGANPIETYIENELYWNDLAELLTWSRRHVSSTLLSCLSAHAALTVHDGISRIRLPAKCTGVFSQTVHVAHPLANGIDQEIVLPLSRWNSVPLKESKAPVTTS